MTSDESDHLTGDNRAEIGLRLRLVREAKQRKLFASGASELTPAELDTLLPPVDCRRTRDRLAGRGRLTL